MTAIEYEAWTGADPGGPGGFRVVLASETVINIGPVDALETGRWTGRVRLTDAADAYVEIEGASQCDVRVRGRWIGREED